MRRLAQAMSVLSMFSAVAALAASDDRANEVQPYLESLKRKYDVKPPLVIPAPSSPSAEERSPPVNDTHAIQPYIELLKENERPSSSSASSDSAGSSQPYIESLKSGHELKPNFNKTVSSAAGFAVVASNHFNVHSDQAQANDFESVYDTEGKYNPGVDLFFEHQVFRSRTAGSIAPIVHLGFLMNRGHGRFTHQDRMSDDTHFRFMTFPVTAGASYRFLQLRFVVPYAQLGIAGIPFVESRDDDKPSRRGLSRGYSATLGVSFNLDWIGRKNAWDIYDASGVLHTYLTLQAEYLRTVSGPVSFNHDGLYAGLMFEF